jgi:hypothetical protein
MYFAASMAMAVAKGIAALLAVFAIEKAPGKIAKQRKWACSVVKVLPV